MYLWFAFKTGAVGDVIIARSDGAGRGAAFFFLFCRIAARDAMAVADADISAAGWRFILFVMCGTRFRFGMVLFYGATLACSARRLLTYRAFAMLQHRMFSFDMGFNMAWHAPCLPLLSRCLRTAGSMLRGM